MTTLKQATAGAERLARSAAISRDGIGACPYPADARGNMAAARRTWLATYRTLRPDEAIPHVLDDLTALAHGPDDNSGNGPVTAPDRLIPDVDGGTA